MSIVILYFIFWSNPDLNIRVDVLFATSMLFLFPLQVSLSSSKQIYCGCPYQNSTSTVGAICRKDDRNLWKETNKRIRRKMWAKGRRKKLQREEFESRPIPEKDQGIVVTSPSNLGRGRDTRIEGERERSQRGTFIEIFRAKGSTCRRIKERSGREPSTRIKGSNPVQNCVIVLL